MLIRLKSSSLVLVVIGSMPMPICNRFHERLANNGKITTFTGEGGTVLWCRRAQVSLNLENWDLDRRMLKYSKFYTQLLHVYLNWFRRNLLLKGVSQPKIAKKSTKLLFWRSKSSKVIEFGGNQEPVYDFLTGPSRGWGRGLATPGPTTFGGSAVGQKYKVRQNVPIWKEKFKKIFPKEAPGKCLEAQQECFSGPRCGSRRAWFLISN